MRHVVVTGLGIVSCLGNDRQSVTDSLREGRSGIERIDEYAQLGLKSHVGGTPKVDFEAAIDRKLLRFMGDAAAYAYLAMEQAVADAKLLPQQISDPRIGIIMGSGGASTANQVEAVDLMRDKGLRRVGPYRVTRTMGSTVSACLATPFQIKGVNYSISSACATSAHCIGNAMELIQLGKQDMIFAGGAEEIYWAMTMMFDAMGALSTQYNDQPHRASRPYDRDRDGFVIAGGAGVLVLEELEHAQRRGAPILAELVGYGATSDGHDMVAPSGEGAARCIQQALAGARRPIDYINSHGTSTPVGDLCELGAIREVFEEDIPPIGSTKSLSGHSLGAAGVHEAIYCLLMMENNFLAASANIDNLDPGAEGMPILQARRDNFELNSVLSNSFGFGGTNASLLFERFDG